MSGLLSISFTFKCTARRCDEQITLAFGGEKTIRLGSKSLIGPLVETCRSRLRLQGWGVTGSDTLHCPACLKAPRV